MFVRKSTNSINTNYFHIIGSNRILYRFGPILTNIAIVL